MGKKSVDRVGELLDQTRVSEASGSADTLHLWEKFRDEALMWRSIALIQAPTSLLICILCFYLWGTRRTTINVPPTPAPGIYAIGEIPDIVFIDTATEFLNLIASYQPVIARRQFIEAQKLLAEPMLSSFSDEMLQTELTTIETTTRTQLFFPDPTETKLERKGNEVTVTFRGDRLKIVAGRELPMVTSEYKVTMATVPHNKINPYGVVIIGASFRDIVK